MPIDEPAEGEKVSSGDVKKGKISTWLGLLLIVFAIIFAGAIGLLLERLTAPTFPQN